MWSGVRLWLKVVLGFIFSISLIFVSITYAMFGAVANDRLDLIVTEATGAQNQVIVFSALIQPLVIHNLFWVSLLAVGFLLIFLYFIEHSPKAFLGPGVLSLIITIFLNLILVTINNYIFAFTGDGTVFVVNFIERIRLSSFVILGLGVLLIAFFYWGSYRKQRAGN